jgi:hypothetical protein
MIKPHTHPLNELILLISIFVNDGIEPNNGHECLLIPHGIQSAMFLI